MTHKPTVKRGGKPALYSIYRGRVEKEQAVGIVLCHIIGQKADDKFWVLRLEDGSRSALLSQKFKGSLKIFRHKLNTHNFISSIETEEWRI